MRRGNRRGEVTSGIARASKIEEGAPTDLTDILFSPGTPWVLRTMPRGFREPLAPLAPPPTDASDISTTSMIESFDEASLEEDDLAACCLAFCSHSCDTRQPSGITREQGRYRHHTVHGRSAPVHLTREASHAREKPFEPQAGSQQSSSGRRSHRSARGQSASG